MGAGAGLATGAGVGSVVGAGSLRRLTHGVSSEEEQCRGQNVGGALKVRTAMKDVMLRYRLGMKESSAVKKAIDRLSDVPPFSEGIRGGCAYDRDERWGRVSPVTSLSCRDVNATVTPRSRGVPGMTRATFFAADEFLHATI